MTSSTTTADRGFAAMSDYYNEKSEIQQTSIKLSQRYIDRAVDAFKADVGEKQPFTTVVTLADFGSSTGANSSLSMSLIIASLRKKCESGMSNIQVIHNDLPTNYWRIMFDYLHSNPESYLRKHSGVYALASGKNFFQQVMPSNSLHFGFSNYSLQWLSKLPCKIKKHCFYYFGAAEEQDAYRKQAAQDWENFLTSRSAELVKGGVLVLHVLDLGELKPVSFEVLYEAAKRLFERGLINEHELLNLNLPIYCRSLAEISKQDIVDRLGLEIVCAEKYPPTQNPLYEAYKTHQDVNRFAMDFTSNFAAPIEPVFFEALDPKRDNKTALGEELWSQFRAIMSKKPEEFKFGYYTGHLFVILRKK